MDPDAELRAELATGCRIVATQGLNDFIWGHLSVRSPAAGTFWMKGAGIGLEEAAPDDMLLLDLEGQVLAGRRPRHLEWPIHAEIYRARPDVISVLHSHAIHSVVFGATDQPLLPISHEAIRWVPPDIPRFTESSDLIDTPELGHAAAITLGQGNGLLLRNHGMVVVGPDIRTTSLQAIFLERACRIQLQMMASGVAYHPASEEDARARQAKSRVQRSYDALWEYFVRSLEAG